MRLKAVMPIGPGHLRAPDADPGDPLYRARSALDSQRPREAQLICEELLKADPRHAQALRIFGCALLMQGRSQDAIAPLETAARELRDPEVDTLLAIALRQAGRQEDALSRLKRAIKRQPPYATAFHELGYLLSSLRRYDEAVEALRRGLEIAPMMPELSIQLGYISLQRRNSADAKLAFVRALEITPTSPDALLGMARAHQELGENTQAADYFRRYLRAKPDELATWLNLGHCLLELGQRDAGYDCFRTAGRGDQKRYGNALTSLASAGRGRFWLRPSAAERFMRGPKN
jgi:tetratricopeptide (TPR) repeat protein